MKVLKDVNNNIKNLRLALRDSNANTSILEITDILSSTEEARSFIYLLDKIDTERELTREILEELISNTHEFNELIIDDIIVIKNQKLINIDKWINAKNLKVLIIVAVLIGIVMGISESETILLAILKQFGFNIIDISN